MHSFVRVEGTYSSIGYIEAFSKRQKKGRMLKGVRTAACSLSRFGSCRSAESHRRHHHAYSTAGLLPALGLCIVQAADVARKGLLRERDKFAGEQRMYQPKRLGLHVYPANKVSIKRRRRRTLSIL